MRQRRQLALYTDLELLLCIEHISDRYSVLQEERRLREIGDRPYDIRGRVRR